MRVIVIAIDGLDAYLVKRWRLEGFMQRIWGTHDVTVAVNPGEKLYTPLIWGAFLLGRKPSDFGYSFKKVVNKRWKTAYGLLYPLYRLRIKLLGSRKLGLRSLMIKLGLFNVGRLEKKLGEIERLPGDAISETIVKKAERMGCRVWIKEFPPYNDIEVARLRARTAQFFDKSLNERLKMLDEVYNFSQKLFNEALDAASSHDLVLYYTPLIDYANHALYRPGKLKPMFHLAGYYRKVEKLVSRVRGRFRDSAILVVSDHGYDPKIHEHSEHGFWSCNKSLPRPPENILDFHDIILQLLRL